MPKPKQTPAKTLTSNAAVRSRRVARGPSPDKTAQTKASIVRAALAEFLDKGFADATIAGVAQRAGVAKGTPYRYFATKEALFAGVVQQELVGALGDILEERRGRDESVQAFLRRTLLIALGEIERKGRAAMARLVIVEGVRFPALVEIYRREMFDPVLDQIKRLAPVARRRGELPDDRLIRHPHLLIAPVWMGILNNQLIDRDHPVDIAGLFEAQLELMFSGEAGR
ncbi:MAG: TetR/AcrR family transcriptional regulator [Rhodopseudomonas sp.]|uniref:TetR/AcrR family transcriptional regulator n=1 Tax=Rhodopseudomonas sp. TaxID=1078 RepID=UPI0039E3425F